MRMYLYDQGLMWWCCQS